MAEDQGKEEEKFDFTPEGEAVGYISLNQARLLAMQTARETAGEYGRRYRNVAMVFEGVEDSENEDYYVVTLSFRPQGQFSGSPGQEQFFVEKEGTVSGRQVLSLPSGGRGRRFPVLPIAIGVVIVGVIAAVAVIFAVGGFGDGRGTAAVAAPTETPVSIGIPTAIAAPTLIPPTDTPIPPTDTPIPPTDTPRPQTATPCPACDEANLVWPSIHTIEPTSGIAGERIEVEGNGGYYYLNGAWDESFRLFPLYFGGTETGSIGCYVHHCSGALYVPVDTAPGRHKINTKGGSPVIFEVTPDDSNYLNKGSYYYNDGKYQLAIMNLANTSYTLGFYVGQSARADP